MTTLALRLPRTPTELLQCLPRRAGAFLLDGGGPDSWGCGETLLGAEATAVLALGDDARDPFAALAELAQRPEHAAVVCALGYDLGRRIEKIGAGPRDDLGLPRLFAAAHPWLLAYSYRDGAYELRAPAMSRGALQRVAEELRAYARRAPSLTLLRRPGEGVRSAGRREVGVHAAAGLPSSSLSRAEYLAAVERVLEYIRAGDVYQVNLSQRFALPLQEEPAALFARMLAWHPAPWSAYVDGGNFALLSNSPECFLQRDGEHVATFPIKGTRPRVSDAARDKAMAADLLSSVKDAAEHLMIVDLERNDLGRVCRFGSVRVARLASLRSFPSLHHLESEVRGELRADVGLAALLRATFPGGSITGAPKIRAMQIIDELEPVARGFYTGAIGVVQAGAEARFNLAIRTAVAARSQVTYHAGGGIVADSVPEDEYDETVLKARAFLHTVDRED